MTKVGIATLNKVWPKRKFLILVIVLGVIAFSAVVGMRRFYSQGQRKVSLTDNNKTLYVHVGNTITFSMHVYQVSLSNGSVLQPLVKVTPVPDPSEVYYDVQGKLTFRVVSRGSVTVSATIDASCPPFTACSPVGLLNLTVDATQ